MNSATAALEAIAANIMNICLKKQLALDSEHAE
jgi:hypothetical protein